MTDDMELVRRFAEQQSERAFEALVARYINLVYSAALRQARDTDLAEEITQAVFIVLARKADSLDPQTVLASWLYRTAGYVAADALKMRHRRQIYEQEAHMQLMGMNEQTETVWDRMLPLLDEAMAQLRDKDRDAVVLRFFENKSLREVGEVMGLEERTAQKRIHRALDKLRIYLGNRGVVSTTAIIAGLVSANSVQAAPVALTKTISIAAMGKGAAVGTSTFALANSALKTLAWARAKFALIVGLAAVVTSVTAIVAVEKITEANREKFIWTTDNLYELPPLIIVRPGTAEFAKNNRRNGEKYRGLDQPATRLLEAAYGFGPQRMVLPAEMPSGTFDFLATLPASQKELQAEIQKQLKLVARTETREIDCLLLRVQSQDRPGVKPASGLNYVQQNYAKGEVDLTDCSFAALCGVLENILEQPVVDQTKTDGAHNISFKWNPGDKSLASVNSKLLSQLGLELVPGREPIEVLIVEKSR